MNIAKSYVGSNKLLSCQVVGMGALIPRVGSWNPHFSLVLHSSSRIIA